MNRLIELASKLTPAQVKEVEDFAEFLSSRKPGPVEDEVPKQGDEAEKPKYVNVDALIGLCAGMGGDKSDKELIREAWDDLIAKYDK